MSRSYSRACYEDAVKNRWYDSVKIGRYKYRDATEEEMLNQAKVNACKSQPGQRSAPRWFVQKMFNRPMRREENRVIDQIMAGQVDIEEAVFPVYCKGAWWLWY